MVLGKHLYLRDKKRKTCQKEKPGWCQENRKELRGLERHRAKKGKYFENQGVVGSSKCIREAKRVKNCSEAIKFCF